MVRYIQPTDPFWVVLIWDDRFVDEPQFRHLREFFSDLLAGLDRSPINPGDVVDIAIDCSLEQLRSPSYSPEVLRGRWFVHWVLEDYDGRTVNPLYEGTWEAQCTGGRDDE